jgi:hypothetical protein
MIEVKVPSQVSVAGRLGQWTLLILLAVAAGGCGRNDVKVYQVAKDNGSAETPAPSPTLPPPVQSDNSQSGQPQMQFALPPGWQQVPPSEMRVASFTVTNTSGPSADVGIIPLPAAGQNELALVNMWRDEVQLPATNNPESADIPVAGDTGKLFEFVSALPLLDGKYHQRILVAMVTRGPTSWFFKMTGEDAFVTSQKDVFLQFLQSVSFGETAPAPVAAGPATPDQNANSVWTVPAGWQSLPPSQFLLAQFLIQADGARAEVNVSELAGEGGGLLANVNRWRGQLGLPPVAQEEDFSKMVDSLTVPGGQAEVVDMTGTNSKTGQPARLVGVVLPQSGQTWFYKLMGDPQLVAAQKDTFIKFIQSARYPDVR